MLNITKIINTLLPLFLSVIYITVFRRSTFCPELPALRNILDTENAFCYRTVIPFHYNSTILCEYHNIRNSSSLR